MCGIVGYTGSRPAAPILLAGLSHLEYRGYDSAGLAVREGGGEIEIVKTRGRLRALYDMTNGGQALPGDCGVGHTRWATHGAPSVENAHPLCSDDRTVVAVHNGIIENYQELRDKLTHAGYAFHSQTDTEIVVKLIHYYARKYALGPVDALARAMSRMRGSYALAVLFADAPGEIYAARKDSPMILALREGEGYLASDVPAILQYARDVYYIGNLEIARLGKGTVAFFNIDREPIEKAPTHIDWDAEAAEKAGYEHFMMKEIHEQPKAARDTLHALIKDDQIDLSAAELDDALLRAIRQIVIVACGSAYHVGVAAQYIIEDLSRIPVRVEIASEFRYRRPILGDGTLAIVISQSGETADSLAALREAKAHGVRTLGIVNVVGSSIAREADSVLYTLAGPEIAVATTKAYSTQMVVLNLLGLYFGDIMGTIDLETYTAMVQGIQALPHQMEEILSDTRYIQAAARELAGHDQVFFIGRNLDYALSLEGSLKLKEISYIHSEAYASGELKHGTISLIEEGTPVIAAATYMPLFDKAMSNVVEVQARGANVLALTTAAGTERMHSRVKNVLTVPETEAMLLPQLGVVPLQLLAYYIALERGCDIDKPRNLAKSVTVE